MVKVCPIYPHLKQIKGALRTAKAEAKKSLAHDGPSAGIMQGAALAATCAAALACFEQ